MRSGPPDPELIARGKLMGRFSCLAMGPWSERNWYPDPQGSHDAYFYAGSAYVVEVST